MLLSSAILYATYRLYAEIFQSYLHTGDENEMREFINFLYHAEDFPLNDEQLWLAVTVLSMIALLLVLSRSLVKHRRASASI